MEQQHASVQPNRSQPRRNHQLNRVEQFRQQRISERKAQGRLMKNQNQASMVDVIDQNQDGLIDAADFSQHQTNKRRLDGKHVNLT